RFRHGIPFVAQASSLWGKQASRLRLVSTGVTPVCPTAEDGCTTPLGMTINCMPAPAETISLGLPVAIDRIDRGLKKLWSESEGAKVKLLPSIVFSQLDSDLPLYLWWQSKFAEPMDPQLWSWIDRLIYDSQTWRDFNAQMRLVETAQREAKQRIVLCDLNWTRLVHFRIAFAQFFDHPSSHHHFREIERGTIVFGEPFRSTAMLYVGCLAALLGWEIRNGK